VFAARHPRSRWVAPVWVIGMTLASTTAIARVAAGKHFWTDILVGAAVGSATGVAIPALHRRREPAIRPARDSASASLPTRTGSLLLLSGRF
jgi:membrane-associated phospholipid phosphatase